ncbi:MAG: LuxR C-terminal-related transcriptional regulator [Bacteroidales bacterium]|nr:LuxR C-terminal-related transcriptional regulator [Bacteroidales bacterium]
MKLSFNIAIKKYLSFAAVMLLLTSNYSCNEQNKQETALTAEAKAKELFDIARSYSEDSLNQEKALDLYSESLELYEQANNRQGMASVYKRMGFAYDYLEDFDKEIVFLRKALAINLDLDNKKEQIVIYNFLGICHTISGNVDSAFYNYNKGLDLTKAIHDTIQIINLYQNMGITSLDAGDYTNAIHCNVQALKYAEAGKLDIRIFDMNQNIAQFYYETGDLVLAEKYLKGATQLLDKVEMEERSTFYNLSGLINLKNNNVKVARENFEKVLELGQHKKSKRVMAAAYSNLSQIALLERKLNEAENFAQKSLEMEMAIDNMSGTITSLIELADVLLQKGNNEKALQKLDRAMLDCQSNKLDNLLPHLYLAYYDVNKQMGNYKKALYNFENYTVVKDSLSGIEVQERIAKLELKHQNDKKQQQIELLNSENSLKQQKIRVRNFFILTLTLLSFALLLLWMLYRQRAIRKFAVMESELQKYILQQKDLTEKSGESQMSAEALTKKYGLTQRETEVLIQLGHGLSNAEIAEKIFVSTNTVKYHMKNIYLKLDVKNRVEALNKL